MPSTQRSQRNIRSTRSRLARPSFSPSAWSPRISESFSTKGSGPAGSQTKPPSPSTTSSGMDPRLEATTGRPEDMASATVSPKPSIAEGKKKTSPRLKCSGFSASAT